MAHRNWFTVTAKSGEAHIYIFDEIGGFGVTAKAFINELHALNGRPVTIHVNSPGGNLFEALPIYNALDRYPGRVTAIVEGVAASAASFIIMAADAIIMPANAMLMMHNASAEVGGGADSMREGARLLDNLNASMAAAYASKSGLPVDRVAALMAATSWFTAEEALALGFADEVREAVKVAAYHDLSRFPNAPANSIAAFAESYWAGRGKAPKPVPVDPNDITDLVPNPVTGRALTKAFHGRHAGRRG